MTTPDTGHETATHRTEGWVLDATDGICPTCLQETIRQLEGKIAEYELGHQGLLDDLHAEKEKYAEACAETIRRLEEKIATLRNPNRVPEGESWRSCGHVAWGTCSTCYVERGKELSAAEQTIRRLERHSVDAGLKLVETVERILQLEEERDEWKKAIERAGYQDLLTPSGLETVLRDLQANIRARVAEVAKERERADAAEGQLAKEKADHADQRTHNHRLLIQISALKSLVP